MRSERGLQFFLGIIIGSLIIKVWFGHDVFDTGITNHRFLTDCKKKK